MSKSTISIKSFLVCHQPVKLLQNRGDGAYFLQLSKLFNIKACSRSLWIISSEFFVFESLFWTKDDQARLLKISFTAPRLKLPPPLGLIILSICRSGIGTLITTIHSKRKENRGVFWKASIFLPPSWKTSLYQTFSKVKLESFLTFSFICFFFSVRILRPKLCSQAFSPSPCMLLPTEGWLYRRLSYRHN